MVPVTARGPATVLATVPAAAPATACQRASLVHLSVFCPEDFFQNQLKDCAVTVANFMNCCSLFVIHPVPVVFAPQTGGASVMFVHWQCFVPCNFLAICLCFVP